MQIMCKNLESSHDRFTQLMIINCNCSLH